MIVMAERIKIVQPCEYSDLDLHNYNPKFIMIVFSSRINTFMLHLLHLFFNNKGMLKMMSPIVKDNLHI